MEGDHNEASFRANAALIAQLLREQDEGPRTAAPSQAVKDNATYRLYRELCFDEPILASDGTTTTTIAGAFEDLSKQLLLSAEHSKKRYALSNRLVDGVLHLARKQSQAEKPSATEQPQDSSTSLLTSSVSDKDSRTLDKSVALLAFTIFVRIPLACCQTSDLKLLQSYLGSFRGVENIEKEFEKQVDQLVDGIEQADLDDDKSDARPVESAWEETIAQPTVAHDENDSLAEVWAAESDPSDYDYNEGVPDIRVPQQEVMPMVQIDPLQLSQPDPTLSVDLARTAICTLLRNAQYNLFSCLLEQRNDRIEQDLFQLTLQLLTESTSLIDNSLRNLALRPLWVLRDAAIHRNAFVGVYLDLLHALLGVHEAQKGQRILSKEPIATATVLGLTSLSAWCLETWSDSSVNMNNYVLTHRCIVESLSEVCVILENVMDTSASDRDHLNHLCNNLIPLLEVLCNLTWSGTNRISPANVRRHVATAKQAPQVLLSSGVFRLLLELGMRSDLDSVALKIQFQYFLLCLCVQSPTVLGRYAWRYPRFAGQMIRMEVVDSTTRIQSLLWNCVGTTLESPATTTRLVWKNKTTENEIAVSAEECKTNCCIQWEKLCRDVANALDHLTTMDGSATNTAHDSALHDFERFVSFTLSCPEFAGVFIGMVDKDNFDEIETKLASMPTELQTEAVKEKPEDEAGNDDSGKQSARYSRAVSSMRKCIKQLVLLFQSKGGAMSKTD